mmetsp:Transcript_28867/g.27651  ORF Transcript_28867/g.27651 Transcript_28867/m.27651 type:complete len:189 (+) Transcript_28867:73-639(+)
MRVLCILFIAFITSTVSNKISIKRLAVRTLSSIGCSIGLFTFNPEYSTATIDPVSIARFRSGYEDLQALDKNWDTVIRDKTGDIAPDNIRRVLGTVYRDPCSAPLCSFSTFINKFVKANSDDLDVSAFDEPSRELQQALTSADFQAYSSVFSAYGNGGGGEDYIGNTRKQVQKGIVAFKDILDVIEAK